MPSLPDPTKSLVEAILSPTRAASQPLPVQVLSIPTTSEEWSCPHCRSTIHEKGLYHDGSNWYHRACSCPIALPPTDPKIVAYMEKNWGIKMAVGMAVGEGVPGRAALPGDATLPGVLGYGDQSDLPYWRNLEAKVSELVAQIEAHGESAVEHRKWVQELADHKIVSPKLKQWVRNLADYYGEKDRSFGEFLVRISSVVHADAPGSIEGYTIEGTVAPGQSVQVVKPDGKTKYQCDISSRSKVTCQCTAGSFGNVCKHRLMVEQKLKEAFPEAAPKKKLRKEMTPEEKEAERIPHEDAKALADEVIAAVKPAISKYEFAGSLGRGRATVHDIDIVAVGNPAKTLELAKTELGVEPIMSGEAIVRFNYQGTMVDITFTKEEEFEPTLLYRTGPKDLNLIMRARAKRKGWKLNEHGLMDASGKVIANTQDGIFKALEMKYLTPSEREKVTLQSGR